MLSWAKGLCCFTLAFNDMVGIGRLVKSVRRTRGILALGARAEGDLKALCNISQAIHFIGGKKNQTDPEQAKESEIRSISGDKKKKINVSVWVER